MVTFYLLVARWPSDVNAAILAVFAVLVFVPIRYVYPSRTPAWSVVTNVAGAMWAGLMLLMLWQYPAVSQAVFLVSLAYPAYYLLLSFALHFQTRCTPITSDVGGNGSAEACRSDSATAGGGLIIDLWARPQRHRVTSGSWSRLVHSRRRSGSMSAA